MDKRGWFALQTLGQKASDKAICQWLLGALAIADEPVQLLRHEAVMSIKET